MSYLKAISQYDITPPENEYNDDEMEQMESEAYEIKLKMLMDT